MKNKNKYAALPYGNGGEIASMVGAGIGLAAGILIPGAQPFIPQLTAIGGQAGNLVGKQFDKDITPQAITPQTLGNFKQFGYGFGNGGTPINTELHPIINAEHKELLVKNGRIKQDLASLPPHPQDGTLDPNGSIQVQKGDVIVPAYMRSTYMNASLEARKAMESKLVKERNRRIQDPQMMAMQAMVQQQQMQQAQLQQMQQSQGQQVQMQQGQPQQEQQVQAMPQEQPKFDGGGGADPYKLFDIDGRLMPYSISAMQQPVGFQSFNQKLYSNITGNVKSILPYADNNTPIPLQGIKPTTALDDYYKTHTLSTINLDNFYKDNPKTSVTKPATDPFDPLPMTAYDKFATYGAPFIDNAINLALTATTPRLPEPILNKNIQLSKRYNIEPQLADLARSKNAALADIAGRTSSGAVYRSAAADMYGKELTNKNQVYSGLFNYQQGVKNAEIQANANIDANNNAVKNAANMQQFARKVDMREQLGKNASDLSTDLSNQAKDKRLTYADIQKASMIWEAYNTNGVFDRAGLMKELADNPNYTKAQREFLLQKLKDTK